MPADFRTMLEQEVIRLVTELRLGGATNAAPHILGGDGEQHTLDVIDAIIKVLFEYE